MAETSSAREPVIGVSEAARRLGVTRQTVYRWIGTGKLAATTTQPPTVSAAEVDSLASGRDGTTAPPDGARTRARIVASAAEIIQRDGIAACTMEAVADEAGISRGGVLHHFADKDHLMSALAERFVSGFESEWAALAEAEPDLTLDRAYLRVTLGGSGALGSAVLLGTTVHEQARTTVASAIERWYDRILADARDRNDPDAVTRCLAADAVWLFGVLRVGSIATRLGEELRHPAP